MTSRLERIYQTLPASIQNLGLTLYGISLLRSRYTGRYRSNLIAANLRYRGTVESVEQYVDERLKDALRAAVAFVPYYRELHASGQFPIERVSGVADLQLLPLLEKEQVRTSPERLVSERYRRRGLMVINTTGTSGTPLRIYCNSHVRQMNYAFHDRFLTQSGIDKRGTRATIGGRIILPAGTDKPPYWRASYFQRNWLFSSYHLNASNIGQYIKKLRDLKPNHIDAYPSSVYAIADYARSNKTSLHGITSSIVTSGETLYDDQRSLIEEQFGARVFDQYGCAEMCVLATTCVNGNYHAISDFGVLEILKDDGSRAISGEEGEIVCTGLINDVMPLVRYRIGDRAIAGEGRCDCGAPFPVIRRILGRMDDVIVTPSGSRVGRLSPVLKGFPVKEAQYIQEKIDEVIVLVVADTGYDATAEKRLLAELRMRLGPEIRIRIERVEKIDRGKGGKLKSIVSRLNARQSLPMLESKVKQ